MESGPVGSRSWSCGGPFAAFLPVSFLLVWLGMPDPAAALVTVSDPNDYLPFLGLDRPTGQFDETGLSGFEFLISSRTGEFRANDQYLISGEETDATTSLGNDLGAAGDLSAITLDFSIQHNLVGGRNFTFRLTDAVTSEVSVLCWGQNCPGGSTSAEILNGIPPISDYNGLQVQVRAQDVVGSTAAVTITALNGVGVAGADFFDETVTPVSAGTIPGDAGRRGQWMLGDSLDLVRNEWELLGTVTLSRPDAALDDLTKVRLSVDLVRDPTLPYVPEPSTSLLMAAGLAGVAGWRRARRPARKRRPSLERVAGRGREAVGSAQAKAVPCSVAGRSSADFTGSISPCTCDSGWPPPWGCCSWASQQVRPQSRRS